MNAPQKPVLNPFDTSSGNGVVGNVLDPFNLWGGKAKPNLDDTSNQPDRPDYIVGYDPKTMNLTDYLQGKYDSSGLDQFKQEALRKGPSQWANLATQDQAMKAADAKEKGAATVRGQTAQSMSDLARQGGLSSGARERASTEGAKNYMAMNQDLTRQTNLNDMQIGMNDEQNRIQELSQLPQLQGQQANMWEQAKQQDISNTTNENERRNQYNQTVYGQQMNAWGANQQAKATAASGKK